MLINHVVSQRIFDGHQATCGPSLKLLPRQHMTTHESDAEMRCLSYNYRVLNNTMKNNYEILSRNYEVFSHDHEIRIPSVSETDYNSDKSKLNRCYM